MPYHSTPCRRSPLRWPYGCFRGGRWQGVWLLTSKLPPAGSKRGGHRGHKMTGPGVSEGLRGPGKTKSLARMGAQGQIMRSRTGHIPVTPQVFRVSGPPEVPGPPGVTRPPGVNELQRVAEPLGDFRAQRESQTPRFPRA
jgi:hypothetical protein